LARYRLADLFLDTFVYNAGATAVGALWAGLPVLTCAGTTYASRIDASLCHAVGLPELVCPSHWVYKGKAVRFGNDLSRIQELKAKLKENLPNSPLFPPALFVIELEQELKRIILLSKNWV
jgi:predicted O-linked N-acetylglucosamine transferase (SPINDLY family)